MSVGREAGFELDPRLAADTTFVAESTVESKAPGCILRRSDDG